MFSSNPKGLFQVIRCQHVVVVHQHQPIKTRVLESRKPRLRKPQPRFQYYPYVQLAQIKTPRHRFLRRIVHYNQLP